MERSGGPGDERAERERAFWDERIRSDAGDLPHRDYRVVAGDRCDRTIPWLPYIGMPDYVEQVLCELGEVQGLAVLDLGAGAGFMSALLAVFGAKVDAVDVSDEALAVCARRARQSGVAEQVGIHNMACEALGFPDDRFDRVVGMFVLHHLDLAKGLGEIYRVLRPGGVAVFVETWGANKLLMSARRLLTGRFGIEKAGSADEQPLGRSAKQLLQSGPFQDVAYVFPDLLFFRMMGYLPWARQASALKLWRHLDVGLARIPMLRRLSYFCVVVLRKPPLSQSPA